MRASIQDSYEVDRLQSGMPPLWERLAFGLSLTFAPKHVQMSFAEKTSTANPLLLSDECHAFQRRNRKSMPDSITSICADAQVTSYMIR